MFLFDKYIYIQISIKSEVRNRINFMFVFGEHWQDQKTDMCHDMLEHRPLRLCLPKQVF